MDEWRILLVEDDLVLATQTAKSLERRPVGTAGQMASVDVANGFEAGMQKLQDTRYDLVVLDIRDDEEQAHTPDADAGDEATAADVGIRLYDEVRSRRSVPIIYFSAVAHLVQSQHNPPFVTVVSKLDEDDDALRKAVRAAVDSRLPALNRALTLHTEDVLRVYMQDFVEQHWGALQEPQRAPDLAHLLARRLASSFGDGTGLQQQMAEVPGPGPISAPTHVVHPMRMYVIPPLGNWTTGDILRGPAPFPEVADRVATSADPTPEANAACDPNVIAHPEPVAAEPTQAAAHWVMLTPACDLVGERRKADYVVLAACSPLADEDEVQTWLQSETNAKAKKLDALLGNNRKDTQADRFHALPAAWDIPGLLVDFQRVTHVRYDDLGSYDRIATLDDPYAQALVNRFGRYLGRHGTPDLDLDLVRTRLRADAEGEAAE